MKKLILALGLLIIAASASAQNMASPQVRDHVKLQKSLEHDGRKASNEAFTIKSAKASLADAKEKQKAERKRQRLNAKRDEIYARIEELKTKK